MSVVPIYHSLLLMEEKNKIGYHKPGYAWEKISCFYEAEDEDMGTVGANKCKRMREKMLSFEGINYRTSQGSMLIPNFDWNTNI